jgi:hypothetical protein
LDGLLGGRGVVAGCGIFWVGMSCGFEEDL